ncbi:MAG: hypothetical protein CMQ61_05275 [Gammaproteobacteria bacterium]|nr:hypothetical protein [Gammaproteobacteria bacterium]
MSDAADRRVHALGEVIPYQWVRSKRRRHTHLVMDDVHGLQLRTPMWVQAGEADRLVATNASWALEVIARRARADADKQPLASGSRLPLLDRDIEVVIRPANKTRVSLRGDQLVVAGPEGVQSQLRDLLERWYRGQARGLLWDRALVLGAPLDLKPTGISIRAQKTRWGSCNRNGGLNLNWRLLLLPVELSDYVLAHELCHLRQMNHSPAFWALLRELMPDYAAREARLNVIRGANLPL